MSFIRGAEATVEDAQWLGRPAVAKRRLVKPYRHPELDARLRDERTRDEANLLVAARHASVPVPIVYDVDRAQATITMSLVSGDALRTVLDADDASVAAARLGHLGTVVARLHAGGVTHGDLTTSNIMVPQASDPASLVLIDFGLGQATQEDEPRAVDLHLLEEALEATHDHAAKLMDAFLETYLVEAVRADEVMRRLEGVRERGRYRGAS